MPFKIFVSILISRDRCLEYLPLLVVIFRLLNSQLTELITLGCPASKND